MVELFHYNKSFLLNKCLFCGVKLSEKKFFISEGKSQIAVCSEYCRDGSHLHGKNCRDKCKEVCKVRAREYDVLLELERYTKRLILYCDAILEFDVDGELMGGAYSEMTLYMNDFFMQRLSTLAIAPKFYYLFTTEFLVRCVTVVNYVEKSTKLTLLGENIYAALVAYYGQQLYDEHLLEEAECVCFTGIKHGKNTKDSLLEKGSSAQMGLILCKQEKYQEALELIKCYRIDGTTPPTARKIMMINLKANRMLKNKEAIKNTMRICSPIFQDLMSFEERNEHIDILAFLTEYTACSTSLRCEWNIIEASHRLAIDSFKALADGEETVSIQKAVCAFLKEKTKSALFLGSNEDVKKSIEDYTTMIEKSIFSEESIEYADFCMTKALCMEKSKDYEAAIDLQMTALGIYRCFPKEQKNAIAESYKLLQRHMYLQARS